MPRQTISTPRAPQAIGPYSQAVSVSASRMVFLSGQIPLNPVTGEMVPGDVVAQTEQVMQNLQAVLTAAELSWTNVVRTTLYLTNLADFSKVNEVYGRYFKSEPPARVTVQVAALPRGAQIEIDALAVV